jgi:16S rRNA (guanine527-N7)-methyltransferase
LTGTQVYQLAKYIELIEEWSGRINLVSRRDKTRLVSKHIQESCEFLRCEHIREGISLMDVGSGAGFPGIPIKVLHPSIDLVLVESKRKKYLFLQQVVESLNLDRVKVVRDRVESIDNPNLKIDVVVARAVASLKLLYEWCRPLMKRCSVLVTIKGSDFKKELNELGVFAGMSVNILELNEKYLIILAKNENSVIKE